MSERPTGEWEPPKKKKTRSPNYPGIGLKDALERAQVLYDQEKRGWTHIDTALHHWGYKPKSGAGLVVVSALLKFGLLVDEGSGSTRRVRLSDNALKYILLGDDDHDERQRLLREAALKPAIHLELWRHYDGTLPSDVSLRRDLILERSFTEVAVREFIPEFRGTIAFAALTDADKMVDDDRDQADHSEDRFGVPLVTPTRLDSIEQRTASVSAKPSVGNEPTVRVVNLPLPGNRWAALQVPQPMSPEAWDYMLEMLKLMKRGIVGENVPADAEESE